MNTDPNTEQLAALAVALNREGRMTPTAAAEAALAHWRAADAVLCAEAVRAEANAKAREATDAAQAPLRDAMKAVRRPEAFPVKLDEALRCWLPRLAGRTGDAFGLYRRFVADNERFHTWKLKGHAEGIPFDEWPAPSKAEVDKLFARDRREAYDEREFWLTTEWFLRWYTHNHTAEVAAARAAAGRQGGRPRKKAKGRKPEAHKKPQPKKVARRRLTA